MFWRHPFSFLFLIKVSIYLAHPVGKAQLDASPGLSWSQVAPLSGCWLPVGWWMALAGTIMLCSTWRPTLQASGGLLTWQKQILCNSHNERDRKCLTRFCWEPKARHTATWILTVFQWHTPKSILVLYCFLILQGCFYSSLGGGVSGVGSLRSGCQHGLVWWGPTSCFVEVAFLLRSHMVGEREWCHP